MASPLLFPSFTTTYHHKQYPAIDPKQPSLNCSKKIIVITGPGRGIGQAIALAFAHAGAKGIALLGRTKATLDETAAEIKRISSTTQTISIPLDITEPASVTSALDDVVRFFGRRPDVLVNNAGGVAKGAHTSLLDVDIGAFRRTNELNIIGPLAVTQAFARVHAASDKADPSARVAVINVSSGAAHLPFYPNGVAYSSSKLAGAKVIEYLYYEFPEWNVFNLQPGVIETDLSRQAGRKADDQPDLPAGMTVWLAASKDARRLNGRFLWANWDVDELLSREDEIHQRELLTLSLKGWAHDENTEDLMKRANSVFSDADK